MTVQIEQRNNKSSKYSVSLKDSQVERIERHIDSSKYGQFSQFIQEAVDEKLARLESPRIPKFRTTGFIYGLRDPLTKEVKYVGQSVLSLETRLSNHIQTSLFGIGNSKKDKWVCDLYDRDLIPDIFLIEEVPLEKLEEREFYWIDYYVLQGCDLTNTARSKKFSKTKAS